MGWVTISWAYSKRGNERERERQPILTRSSRDELSINSADSQKTDVRDDET